MASEFQSGIDEMVKEADLEDAKKAFNAAQEFNPKNQFKKIVDPNNDLQKELDIESEFAKEFSSEDNDIFADLKDESTPPSPEDGDIGKSENQNSTQPKTKANKKQSTPKSTTTTKPKRKKTAKSDA